MCPHSPYPPPLPSLTPEQDSPCVCGMSCVFPCLFTFTKCLFAEPVSFRNHLLIWIFGWPWVDTSKYRGSWEHFLNEHLLSFFLFLFPFLVVHVGVQTLFEPKSISASYTHIKSLHLLVSLLFWLIYSDFSQTVFFHITHAHFSRIMVQVKTFTQQNNRILLMI